ncbi:response regulator transcription factor [bacterium]|nr:response regulator transcription factor [bacterium]
MRKKQVLIIEDDEDIQELVAHNLTREGYTVIQAYDGEKGLQEAKNKQPVIILLDLMLPEMDGLDVCRYLKKETKTEEIPVVMLSAKGEETDIVTGLELGAEDYITKPFSPKVLIARIRTVLRRKADQQKQRESGKISVHDIIIHPGRHEVLYKNKKIVLTMTEFKVLQLLAQKPGWVFTRSRIVDGVKGEDYPVTERSIDVQIVGLRKKLGKAGDYINTVRGVGYKFEE